MLVGTYENQDEEQFELRNGEHKYQSIILADGSIAPENRKSMKSCKKIIAKFIENFKFNAIIRYVG